MSRWSLINTFCEVSHRQFVAYTAQLKAEAERCFGTACELNIRAMQAPKLYSTYAGRDYLGGIKAINDERTLLQTPDIGQITPALWREAKYVEVTVRPADASAAPASAFAHAEFKGTLPRNATFYIQPDSEEAAAAMHKKAWCVSRGDGFTSNGMETASYPRFAPR